MSKNEQDIYKYIEIDYSDIILFDTPSMEKSLEFPKNLITKLTSFSPTAKIRLLRCDWRTNESYEI